jgi:hypothetical protein
LALGPLAFTVKVYTALFEIIGRLQLPASMVSLKIVPWKLNAVTRSRRIDAKDWERLRPRLEELYIKDDKTLKEVVEIMARDHSFNPR